jgi:hypothetical protein
MKRSDLGQFRERSRRRMLAFDFAAFMKKYEITVEQLMKLISYTYGGVEKMMVRGTVKPHVIEDLQRLYPDIMKYVKKGPGA